MFRVTKIFVFSLLVVAIALPALATTSRVASLGGPARYINDDSDIFRWYGTLPSYTKMVMAEVGQASVTGGTLDGAGVSADYQALGFTHNWGEDHWLGTWGIFLLHDNLDDNSFFAFNPLVTPGVEVPMPSTKFVLSWGKELGSVALGLSFTRSDGSIEIPGNDPDKLDMNFTTIGGGLRFDMGENMYGDAAVTFGFAGGDLNGGWDKSNAYNLEARLFYELLDDCTVVPWIGYNAGEYAVEAFEAPSGQKLSDFGIGAAFNWDVNTNNMLIFAAEFDQMSWELSKVDDTVDPDEITKINGTVLPKFYIGLESDITSWFTFRVGATKEMTKYKVTFQDGTEVTITDLEWVADVVGIDPEEVNLDVVNDFQWNIGGGFHVGEWDIDAMFSPDLPFRMGYWMTGYGTGDADPVIGRISATYRY